MSFCKIKEAKKQYLHLNLILLMLIKNHNDTFTVKKRTSISFR